MKRIRKISLLLLFLLQMVNAKEPTFLQYFFSIKKVLPSAKTVALLIPEDIYEQQKIKIARAAKQTNLSIEVYPIAGIRSIGPQMKSMKKEDILLVYDAPILSQKSSMMYILSKSKEKKIPVISASEGYIKSGALIGLARDESNRTCLILNLKHAPYLAAHFTDDVLQKIKAKQIIR